LEHLGVKVTFLTPSDIAGSDLGKFDVVLLGVHTYAAREDLRTHNNRLLDYVKNGGVVIVQYNTPEFDNNYGPYPYTMGRNPEEVTDEVSRVNILAPSNPILNWPNRITEKDFAGWVESAVPSGCGPGTRTTRLCQEPQKGGLLYIYNAYAFYRQLPEGVAGAYRIFANMLSLARNPNR
jgi:hypothetical protein